MLVTYGWVLKFHISNKSDKPVILGVTGGIELQKKEQEEAKLQKKEMSSKFRFNYLSMKIA